MKLDLPIIPRRYHQADWFKALLWLKNFLEVIAKVVVLILNQIVIPLVEGLLSGLFGSPRRQDRRRL
jgi:hypothetical protein